MLTSIKAYVSFLWGIIVLVLLTSTFSFSQGFINYQAFIYEKVTVVQPGSDLVQMLPYANKSASLFIELRNNDSLFFQENHLNLFTDEQGMVVLNIGSKDSILFREIPWSKLIFGKVVLKISWSQTPAGPRTVIDSALLSGSPFSIKSVFTDSSQYAVNSFSARIADSSNMAKKSVYSDIAVFSKNAIQGILLDTTNESLLFPLINGDTLRSSSLAELRINNVSVFRQGTVCQGDSVLLYSGNLADTALFRSYWFSLHNSQRDTLATNVSSLKFVLDSNSRILFGVQRKVAIAGLLNYAEDTLNLKITDFLNLLDSISLDRVFNKSSFCVNDSIILPTWTNAWGTWRILTPRFAKILQGVVKFKSAGHVTLGFFPFNACPFDVFHFNCVARSNSTASIAQSICEGQSFTFGSQVLTSAGTYTRTIPSANGCDSVITLTLTTRSNSTASIAQSICEGQSFTFGSQVLTSGGTYTRTIPSANGCDSVITLTLTVVSNNTIALSSAAGTDTQTVTVNTAMTDITYSTSGATGATVSGLPAGVSGSWANHTVTINGTPTATGIFNYTVTMTGGCTGGTNTATGTIVVNQRSSGPGSSNR